MRAVVSFHQQRAGRNEAFSVTGLLRHPGVLGYEPDGFPFQGNGHCVILSDAKLPIGEIGHGNFEIVIILTLPEEQRVLRPFLNNADDLTGKDVSLQILLGRSLLPQDHDLFRTDAEPDPIPYDCTFPIRNGSLKPFLIHPNRHSFSLSVNLRNFPTKDIFHTEKFGHFVSLRTIKDIFSISGLFNPPFGILLSSGSSQRLP
jgi:hypothetical protein